MGVLIRREFPRYNTYVHTVNIYTQIFLFAGFEARIYVQQQSTVILTADYNLNSYSEFAVGVQMILLTNIDCYGKKLAPIKSEKDQRYRV